MYKYSGKTQVRKFDNKLFFFDNGVLVDEAKYKYAISHDIPKENFIEVKEAKKEVVEEPQVEVVEEEPKAVKKKSRK